MTDKLDGIHKHEFDWYVSRGNKVIKCVTCRKSLDAIIFKMQKRLTK